MSQPKKVKKHVVVLSSIKERCENKHSQKFIQQN